MGQMLGTLLGRLQGLFAAGTVDRWVQISYTHHRCEEGEAHEVHRTEYIFAIDEKNDTMTDCTQALRGERGGPFTLMRTEGAQVSPRAAFHEPVHVLDDYVSQPLMDNLGEDAAAVAQPAGPPVATDQDGNAAIADDELPKLMFTDEVNEPAAGPKRRTRRGASLQETSHVDRRGRPRPASLGELRRRMSIEGLCEGVRSVTGEDGRSQLVRRVRLSFGRQGPLSPIGSSQAEDDEGDELALDVDIPVRGPGPSPLPCAAATSPLLLPAAVGPKRRRVTVSLDPAPEGLPLDDVKIDVVDGNEPAASPLVDASASPAAAPVAPLITSSSELETALLRLMSQASRDEDNPVVVATRKDIHLLTAYLASTLGIADGRLVLSDPCASATGTTAPPSTSTQAPPTPGPAGGPPDDAQAREAAPPAADVESTAEPEVMPKKKLRYSAMLEQAPAGVATGSDGGDDLFDEFWSVSGTHAIAKPSPQEMELMQQSAVLNDPDDWFGM